MNASAIATDDPIQVAIDASLTPHLRSIVAARPSETGAVWNQLAAAPDTPEALLFAFLNVGLYLDELAHRQGPPSLLAELAHRFHSPEAITTLLTQAYAEAAINTEQFDQLLREHGHNCKGALDSLDRTAASNSEKHAIYLAFVKDDQARRRIIDASTAEAHAKTSRSSSELRKLFDSQEPRVLRAIADNPKTPMELLEKLAAHEGTPLARVIRSLASANLRSRRHGNY